MYPPDMISTENFAEELIRLGAGWRKRPLPRKRRDRQILMKSFLLTLDSSRTYTEPEINERIIAWNVQVAPAIETDYVTLRRLLVDHGHLERRADGGTYQVGFPPSPLAFDLEVDDLDVVATIAAYREAHPPGFRSQRQKMT